MAIDHFAVWRELPIAVIDLETSGFDALHGDRVVQVAAVRLEGMKIARRWSSLINPERSIPEEASRVHGLYDEDVALAPRFAEIVPTLADICADAVPCAYNMSFDRAFMLMEFFEAKKPHLDLPILTWPTWLDALHWVRSIDRFLPNEKSDNTLVNACARRGIKIEGAHGAPADALACAQLLVAIAPDMARTTVSDLIYRQKHLDTAWDRRKQAAKAAGRVS